MYKDLEPVVPMSDGLAAAGEMKLTIEGVAQEHAAACGLACVAFVTGEAYGNVARGEPLEKLEGLGFLCPELVQKLAGFGHEYSWKKLPEDERDGDFNVGDIVFIERSSSYPDGHFLARSSSGWMDPWMDWSAQAQTATRAVAGFREALPGRAE
jgi:hypothetical protein